METFQFLLHGFSVALQPMNLFYCFVGVLCGTLVGVLPAIGPPAAVALLLPTAYHLNPVGAIIMLAGINYGAMYGGSITSILINVPGEAASIMTCLDGYQMALKGRAGPALGIAAYGSFIAGTLSIIGLMLFAPTLARMALHLGSPEYFTLMVLSLTMVSYMVRGSMAKALMMVACGLILSTVGMDAITGKFRFTYNTMFLQDGIHVVPLVIGLFGLSEVLSSFEKTIKGELLKTKIKGYLPTLQDWKDSIKPILRGGALGFFMGILPGITPMVSTFISYGIEKKLSKHPEKFGTGVIEGVAGPEAANNAVTCGSQVPLFSLGIPTGPMGAMLLSAFMIWGLTPGPQFIKNSPDLFWGLIASMYLGNVLLLILNLPLIPLWVRVLRIPFVLLSILILIFCIIGSYSIYQEMGDIYLLFILGLVGFLAKKFAYEPAPLILGFILGPMIETALRQSLILSNGSFSTFINRPISVVLLAITLLIAISAIFQKRKEIAGEHAEENDISEKGGTFKWDRITAPFGLFFGLYIIKESFALNIGGFHQPGPGFFPLFGGILLAVFSAVLLFHVLVPFRAIGSMARGEKEKPRCRSVVYAYIGFIIYSLIFEWLGFILSTFLLVIYLLRILQPRKWWSIILTAAIVATSAYTVFNVLLKSELPMGILGLFF